MITKRKQPNKTRYLYKRINKSDEVLFMRFRYFDEYTDITYLKLVGRNVSTIREQLNVRVKLAKAVFETAIATTHQLKEITLCI